MTEHSAPRGLARGISALGVAALLLLSGAADAAAQAVSVQMSIGRSGFDDFASPWSVRVEGRSPEFRRFSAVAGGRWSNDVEQRLEPKVCDPYFPSAQGCVLDFIESDVRVRSFWVGLSYRIPTEPVRVEFTARALRHDLSADYFSSDSGQGTGPYAPSEVDWGPGIEARLDIPLPVGLPLSLLAGYTVESIGFDACADDIVAPFCGDEILHEIGLGLALNL